MHLRPPGSRRPAKARFQCAAARRRIAGMARRRPISSSYQRTLMELISEAPRLADNRQRVVRRFKPERQLPAPKLPVCTAPHAGRSENNDQHPKADTVSSFDRYLRIRWGSVSEGDSSKTARAALRKRQHDPAKERRPGSSPPLSSFTGNETTRPVEVMQVHSWMGASASTPAAEKAQ